MSSITTLNKDYTIIKEFIVEPKTNLMVALLQNKHIETNHLIVLYRNSVIIEQVTLSSELQLDNMENVVEFFNTIQEYAPERGLLNRRLLIGENNTILAEKESIISVKHYCHLDISESETLYYTVGRDTNYEYEVRCTLIKLSDTIPGCSHTFKGAIMFEDRKSADLLGSMLKLIIDEIDKQPLPAVNRAEGLLNSDN